VSSVCATALFRCLVDLDVLDDQVASVETLGVCVGFGILQQAQQKFSTLDGPSCAGDTELLSCKKISSACTLCFAEISYPHVPLLITIEIKGKHTLCSTSGSTSISSHRDSLFVFLDTVKQSSVLPGRAHSNTYFSKNLTARCNFHPLMAWAVSRVFLKETRR
jgi:hypothetical protein